MDTTPIGFEFNRKAEVLDDLEFPREIYLVDSTIRSLQSGISGSRHTAQDLVDIGVALSELGVRELIINVTWRDGLQTIAGLKRQRPTARLVATLRARRSDWRELIARCGEAGADEVCIESAVDAAGLRSVADVAHNHRMDVSHGFAETYTYEEVVTVLRAGIDAGCKSQSFHDSFFRLAISPEAMKSFIRSVRHDVDGLPPLYVHLSNFFGQATMTSVAALTAGATAVDVCANGTGHHCGHTSLAEVALVVESLYGRKIGIDLERLHDVSVLLQERTGVPILAWQPVVGEFAFMGDAAYWAAEANVPFADRVHATFPINPVLVGAQERVVWNDRTLTTDAVAQKVSTLGLRPLSDAALGRVIGALRARLESVETFPNWLTDDEFVLLLRAHLGDEA
jgi:isopropylmalate/homocitrate/citramalate synthase